MWWLALLAAGSASAGDDWFYAGDGPARVRVGADLVAPGLAHGRTGDLVVRSQHDPTGIPGVAGAVALGGGVWRVRLEAGIDDLALARSLREQGHARWAVPDLLLELVPTHRPDDPMLADQWHLENEGGDGLVPDTDIDAELAWDLSTGAGQLVAILDTGVELDHPDLSVLSGWDFVDGDADAGPPEDGPHGTACAGIAAAAGDNGYGVTGVAYEADVLAVRMIGSAVTLSDLYDAFLLSVDSGASVISNSWGFSSSCEEIPSMTIFDDMLEYAEQQGRGGLGTAVVFSAGNGGCDLGSDGLQAIPSAISVAAIEGDDARASYSNYGEHVDIGAPTGLLTTDLSEGGYGEHDGDGAFAPGFSGTSAAAPVVSGVLALMFAANERLTAADAREVLCATAVRNDGPLAEYDSSGWSPWYGCGRVNAAAAVAAVANEAPDAPSPRLLAEEAWEDRVVLSWKEAADPDGERLVHRVTWAVAEEEQVEEVRGGSLDLTGRVAAGESLVWSVQAVDAWGPGPSSEAITLRVIARPEPAEPTGCAHGVGGGWIALLAALGGLRHRRRA